MTLSTIVCGVGMGVKPEAATAATPWSFEAGPSASSSFVSILDGNS